MSQPATQTGYDVLGRPSAVTAPDGTRSEHRYGVLADGGTILAWHDVLDPNRHRMQSRTDTFGRLVQVLELSGNCGSWGYPCSGVYTTPWAAGTTTHYRYDVLDRLTTVTRGSLVTTIGYDAAGRKTQLQDPDMGTWTYAYDGAGNLVKQRDARTIATCLSYDALHRLEGKTYHSNISTLEGLTCPGSPYVVTYSYDAYDGTTQFGRGRRTGMVDRSGATTWTYDQRGRVTKEEKTITGVGIFRTQWGYRADDRAYKMQFPGGPTGSIGEQVDFTYHPQQLVNRVSTTSQVYVASSRYDAAGRLVGRSLGTDTVIATAAYFPWDLANGQGRLQRLTAVKAADATTLQDLRYSTTSTGAVGYDAVGNLLTIEDWKAGSPQVHSYSYDERDRLLSASVTGGIGGNYSETDAYDPITGTLSSKAGVTYGYADPAHRHAVTHRGSTLSYSYDANGNQTWRSVWGTSASLSYDEENHLTGVSGGATASFAYDGDGRLVTATVNGTTTIYIGNYYEYQLGSGTTRKYYYAGSQRVAMRESGILSWLLSDHLGSTTIAANSAGTLSGERRYQAWGWARYSAGTIPTNFRFTGQRQLVLGLYSYGARWYDTITGRFIQPDTIVPEPGNPLAYDRYAYALNNPVRYTDPTGHCWGVAAGIRGLQVGSYGMGTNCANIDNALTIARDPDASVKDKLIANAYLKAWEFAGAGLAFGAIVCAAQPVGCATAAQAGAVAIKDKIQAVLGQGGQSVWKLDKFERGRVIEERLGRSNFLTQNFPTIDRFENGIATSIKSIDLRSAAYQNITNLDRTVRGYVDTMANYQGQPRPWGGVTILPHQITGRAVNLAIPTQGAAQAQLDALAALQQYAQSVGVTLNIIPIQ